MEDVELLIAEFNFQYACDKLTQIMEDMTPEEKEAHKDLVDKLNDGLNEEPSAQKP